MHVVTVHHPSTPGSQAKHLLTVQQAARVLGLVPAAVERLARAGAFPGATKGRKGWRIPARAAKARGGLRITVRRDAAAPRAARQEPVRLLPSQLTNLVRRSRVRVRGLELGPPATRGACEGGPRPCVRVGCRYALFLDVCGSGSIVLNAPGAEPHELLTTCALDVAAEGPHSVDQVAELLGSTRERIAQIEARALRKLAPILGGGLEETPSTTSFDSLASMAEDGSTTARTEAVVAGEVAPTTPAQGGPFYAGEPRSFEPERAASRRF